AFRHGLIRPHGTRELQLTFRPSLAGPFLETISVHNVVITVKAAVTKRGTFHAALATLLPLLAVEPLSGA
ncbi:hypothetical protein T492DRAFT_865822, partial [Pavlovales sp. CCMP2436]